MAVTVYATQTDVENILSYHGVESFLDDDQDGFDDGSIMTAVLERASLRILQYCQRVDISQSPDWVKYATAVLASCYLVTRRGNPNIPSLKEQCDEVIEWLEGILDGSKELPGVSQLKNARPFTSNLTVQYGNIKVVRDESTGGSGDITQNGAHLGNPYLDTDRQ